MELSTDQKFEQFVAKVHCVNLYDPDPNTETVSYLTAITTKQKCVEFIYTNQGRGMYGKGSFQIPFEYENEGFYVTTTERSNTKENFE